MSIQKELSDKLVKLYLLALCAVALFSIVSHIVMQVSMTQQQNDARVVNIAGRQRMLSQRLTKTCILLANHTINNPEFTTYKQDLMEIIPLWAKCHSGLISGKLVLETRTNVINSPQIDSMFLQINPYFKTMISNAEIINNILQSSVPINELIIQQSLKEILQNERFFLLTMNKIVFQYDMEAQQRVGRLKKIEFCLLLITLLILILEGIFIFKPTYILVNNTVDTIKKSENALISTNNTLKNVNETLYITQKQLLKITEEKYKLLLKEDKIRSLALLEGQEEERKRISLELHDGIGQMLTGIKLMSENININLLPDERDQKTIANIKQLVSETIAETRVISFNMMPAILYDFGTIAAIKSLIEQIQISSPIAINFNYTEIDFRLPKNVEITLYRIVQEAINNTIKHAQATKIDLTFGVVLKEVVLVIADNGCGFAENDSLNLKNQQGMMNIRSRVDVNNGSCTILSHMSNGTIIDIKIPFNLND